MDRRLQHGSVHRRLAAAEGLRVRRQTHPLPVPHVAVPRTQQRRQGAVDRARRQHQDLHGRVLAPAGRLHGRERRLQQRQRLADAPGPDPGLLLAGGGQVSGVRRQVESHDSQRRGGQAVLPAAGLDHLQADQPRERTKMEGGPKSGLPIIRFQ